MWKKIKLLFGKLKIFFIKLILKKKVKLLPIEKGIVIDHITAGQAPNILKVLKIEGGTSKRVGVITNARSWRLGKKGKLWKKGKPGKKDVVKIEGRVIDSKELNKIALIAPRTTISEIKDYRVVEKYKVEPPEEVKGILTCLSSNCITNSREPVKTKFLLVSREPVKYKCYYCERVTGDNELMKSMEGKKEAS